MCKNKAEFDALVEEYRKLSAQIKKADERLDAVKEDMESYMKAKGTPGGKNGKTLIVYGNGYKASLTPCESSTLDKEKLTDLLGDSLAQYQKTKSYNQIRVS